MKEASVRMDALLNEPYVNKYKRAEGAQRAALDERMGRTFDKAFSQLLHSIIILHQNLQCLLYI